MGKEDSPSDTKEELVLMAESIANYRNDLKNLRSRNEALESKLRRWDGFNKASHVIGFAGVVIVCIGVVYGIGFLLYQWIAAPHESGKCYIERHTGTANSTCPCIYYSLHKSLDWRGDPQLGYYHTIEDAVEEATRLGCKTTNANISR